MRTSHRRPIFPANRQLTSRSALGRQPAAYARHRLEPHEGVNSDLRTISEYVVEQIREVDFSVVVDRFLVKIARSVHAVEDKQDGRPDVSSSSMRLVTSARSL